MKLGLQSTFLLLTAATTCAQLAVTVSPVKVTGSKAVVPPALKNTFGEKIESARAVCFLLDEQGKVIRSTTQWIIGGAKNKPGLAAGATNTFHFVVATDRNRTTNLTARVNFSCVILAAGKLADPARDVRIQHTSK